MQFWVPVKALGCKDAAWSWKGNWATNKNDMIATGAGAEATLKFTGTGVAFVGNLAQRRWTRGSVRRWREV